jgi:transcriptional regulator with XRE-family HTH domain
MDRKTKPEWVPFGAAVRRLRKERGYTGVYVADRIGLSATMYSSIERGIRFCLREHAARLDEVLETGDAVMRLWTRMTSPDKLPDWYYKVGELEQAATEIREYQPVQVPGVLQTPEYAHATLSNLQWWEDDQVDRLVEARTTRLRELPRTRLSFAIDEHVLWRRLASADVIRGQLDQLYQLAGESRITVLIVPSEARQHPTPSGAFRIMTLGDGRTVGHEEATTNVHVVTGLVANTLLWRFGTIQGEALSPSRSLDLIDKVRKEI